MTKSFFTATTAVLFAIVGAGAATLEGTVRQATSSGTGATIPAAKVVLMGFGGGGLQEKLDSTTTNNQGEYSFSDVSLGYRQVIVTKAGFDTGQAFANVTQNNGEYIANVTLAPAGGNVGKVTGTVHAGTATGDGIPGALLILTRPAGGGQPAFADTLNADGTGRYTFDDVPAVNNYTLRVTATGYNPATNTNVDVEAGDTTTADFTLTAIPGPPKPGSIAGTIRKSGTSSQIPGARIVLSRSNSTVRDTAMADGEGHYAFDSVAANTNYVLTVTATGYQTATNTDVDVAANATSIVDFQLIPTGQTASGSIIGTVLNKANAGVANARVILSRSGTTGGSGAIDTVMTDTHGDYTFEGVPALTNYIVSVSASGYQSASNNNVDVVAGQAVVAEFVLLADATGILSGAPSAAGFRIAGNRGVLQVEFAASPWAGRLSAYDARGSLAYSGSVPAGSARMSLPSKTTIRFLLLERGGMTERLQVAPIR